MKPNGRIRARNLAIEGGISKELFMEKTGYSEDQWYYWFGGGNKAGSPNPDQIYVICKAFDWSPTYIFYGIGFKKLSDVESYHATTMSHSQLELVKTRQQEILNKLDNIAAIISTSKLEDEIENIGE